MSKQGPSPWAQDPGPRKGKSHSPGPPQLVDAPALRSTGEDNEGPSVREDSPALPAPGCPEPSLLPRHSCRSLAHQGCPDHPSVLFPQGPLGGLSALGHIPHRCSEEGKGGWWAMGLRRPGWAGWGNPLELSPGILPGVLHPHALSPQPHPCGSFASSSGDPIPTLALSFLQQAALVGPSQSHFPDRRVGGGGGARRGTICPGCSCNLHLLWGRAMRV